MSKGYISPCEASLSEILLKANSKSLSSDFPRPSTTICVILSTTLAQIGTKNNPSMVFLGRSYNHEKTYRKRTNSVERKGRTSSYPSKRARQVGKSHLVEQFGRTQFEDIAVVDFESRPELKGAFSSRDPKEILTRLEFALRKPIKAGKSLLFLDEIQECKEALSALRYFKEKMPELHVIAAGSLLEFLLRDEVFSFPVGRVDFLYLKPLSFIEYLEAACPFVAERLALFDLQNPPAS